MISQIKEYNRPEGQIQRVQLVRLEDWRQLKFLPLSYQEGALECFAKIYEQYLVPACPWLFGNMIMFRIPEGMQVCFSRVGKYGELADELIAAAAAVREGVRFHGGKPVFRSEQVRCFWKELESRGCLRIVRGKLPITTVIPVGQLPGFLSRTAQDARLRVNAPFFIMDRFDCATVYDHVGTPLGLRIQNGIIEAPPLYGREALLVKADGTVTVETPDVRDLLLQIRGVSYKHGVNASIYTRPERSKTPQRCKKQLVIVGSRVVAVCHGGSVPIPASGFVLEMTEECAVEAGDPVVYGGMEDVRFGIQVGNSILRDGKKTQKFLSRFYNIRHLEPVPFPPSLYPMGFHRDRAARIALGADREGKPMLLWAEGAAKQGHISGEDSVGATLSEMADICQDLGMHNAINLDGGGSAQLLLGRKRSLRISDRDTDGTEVERPIPMALIIP